MSIKGKYYIWLNTATTGNWYWMQQERNWTSSAHGASMFSDRVDAEDEASQAQAYSDRLGLGEVHVLQATKELSA